MGHANQQKRFAVADIICCYHFPLYPIRQNLGLIEINRFTVLIDRYTARFN